MWVGILGPLRIVDDGRVIDIPAPKERAVVESLALRAGDSVSVDHLIELIWGTDPPETALKTLRTYVSRLRALLGGEAIATTHAGYRLTVDADDVDALRLDVLVRAGTRAATAGDALAARAAFAEGERLWRGEPLSDLADAPGRWGQATRLGELHRRASHGRVTADLELGHHEQVVAELEAQVAADPLNEPFWEQLVLALYRSGRQIDALRAARRAREQLGARAGLEPSAALQRLEWQVLVQDSQLDLGAPLPATSLPAPLDSFVGRADEVVEIADLVRGRRLVTLHGPAGVGKTRLAVEVARRLVPDFPDGVRWVDITSAHDVDGVASLLAADLAVSSPDTPLLDALADHLRHRVVLLVLDNCEQAIAAVAAVCAALLGAAPRLSVLLTSRSVVGADGEYRCSVAPLSVPEPDASRPDVATSEAVQLFLDRAAAQDRRGAEEFDLGEVGALTRHLDGLPLAIELAAARTRHLAPAEISRRLAERMSVLGPGPSAAVPAHHRTMQAGIEWSYDLLDPGCRHLFDVLSVMPADFDLDTAEAVAAVAGIESSAVLDHLGRLIDASMVAAPAAPGDRRYRVLVLLRQYGAERLEARGEADRARQAHADHFRAFARAAGVGIDGPEAGCWWERVATERAHLRAAVEWSVRHDDPQSTLDFARLLARAAELVVNADFLQVVELFRSLLDGADGTPPSPRGWAWLGMVGAAYLAGDLDLALGAGDSALTLFTEADDPDGLASAQSNLAFALLLGAGDAERARQLFAAAESAARVSGLHALEAMSSAAGVQCRLISDEPLDSIEPALVRSEALPDAGWATLRAHRAMNRFYFAYRAGDLDGAERAARQARQFSTAAGSSIYDQSGLIGVGVVALARHDIDGARGPLLHAAQIAADVSNAMQLGAALMALAATADAAGDEVAASRLWGAGTSRAPVWPLVADRWFPARAADTLGDRFEAEVKRGRDLAVRQALDLAVG